MSETPPTDALVAIELPARTIPPPLSLSALAREALSAGAARTLPPAPSIEDLAGWRDHIAAWNGRMQQYVDLVRSSAYLSIEVQKLGGVDAYVARRTDETAGGAEKVNLHLHGGGWIFGGGPAAALPTAVAASQYGGLVYGVDYRTAPDHPFPAALEDCFEAYSELLRRHASSSILVSGDSAGGNLAAALMLKARDAGLPPPGALLLNTPVTDLTMSSDSWAVNAGADLVLGSGPGDEAKHYRNGADPTDPYVSPLFGDLTRGFPPTYIRTGTRDLLLSDSVRMHAALRKAGVDADLYVGEAMPHGGFAMLGVETPEDVDARADTIRWLDRHWRPSGRPG